MLKPLITTLQKWDYNKPTNNESKVINFIFLKIMLKPLIKTASFRLFQQWDHNIFLEILMRGHNVSFFYRETATSLELCIAFNFRHISALANYMLSVLRESSLVVFHSNHRNVGLLYPMKY